MQLCKGKELVRTSLLSNHVKGYYTINSDLGNPSEE